MLTDKTKRWWHRPLALITNKNDRLSSFGRAVRWMIILLVFGVLGLVAVRFEFGRVRGAEHFIDKARLAVANTDWEEARSSMEQVQDTEKANPAFLRVVADYLVGTRSSPALLVDTLERLEAAGKAVPQDALWMSMACHAAGDIRQARAAWERLPASLRGERKALEVEIDLLVAEGRMQEAAAAENRLLESFPDIPEIVMRQAARLQRAPFTELQAAATRQLLELAVHEDMTGLQSIQILARRTDLMLQEAERVLELAKQRADIVVEERLVLVSMVMRLAPTRREALIQMEIEHHQGKGAAIRGRLASWLVQEREFLKFHALVADEALLHPADLYPLKAQVLVAQERWRELLDLVGKYERVPLAPARAAVWRALATRHLTPERVDEIRAHLEEAIRLGSSERSVLALQGAAALAEEWSMIDLAFDAFQQLARPGTQGESAMLEKCWALASLLKDSAALATISARLHDLRPEDPLAMKRHDYLRLLRGEEVESTLMAEVQMASLGKNSAIRLLQALKAYRMHDLPLASDIMHGIPDTTDLTTGEKAVFAGLLATVGGDPARSFRIVEKIRPDMLLQEERAFWKRAR